MDDNTSKNYTSNAVRNQGKLLDGSDDHIRPPDNFGLSTDSDFTVSGWMYIQSIGSGGFIMGLYDGTDDLFTLGHSGSSDFQFRIGHYQGDEVIAQSSGLSTNNWYHLAGTWNSEENIAKLYVNGKTIASVSGPVSDPFDSETMFTGGRSDDTRFIDGSIDDVRIYNRRLRKSEIEQLYQWGTRGKNLKEAIENYQPN